jgi:hypothetical protein
MKFVGQILGGTQLDTQGEKLSKEVLEIFCAKNAGIRMPLGEGHDVSLPPQGYIENLRLEPHETLEEEWVLKADIFCEEEALKRLLRGFSISFLEPAKGPSNAIMSVHVPYPSYNDSDFMMDLAAIPRLGTGRWVKKAADPTTIAALTIVLPFVLAPAWDKLYKERFGSYLDVLLDSLLPKLQRKGLTAEFIHIVPYDDRRIEIRLLSPRGSAAFNYELVLKGLSTAATWLETRKNNSMPIPSRLVLQYDAQSDGYVVTRSDP